MADLSAVLRKTIDGLPNASPQLRAKVYEKARAAIARQIQSANPPLSSEIAEARTEALEDAIDRTEAHYTAVEALSDEHLGEDGQDPGVMTSPDSVASAPVQTPPVRRAPAPASSASPLARSTATKSGTPIAPPSIAGPAASAGTIPVRAPMAFSPAAERAPAPMAPTPAPPASARVAPARDGALQAPGPRAAPIERPPAAPGVATEEPRVAASAQNIARASVEPAWDGPQIPAADIAAPRYPAGRKPARSGSRVPLAASIVALLVIGGAAIGAYVFRSDVERLLGLTDIATATLTPPAAGTATAPGAAPGPGKTGEMAALPSATPQTAPAAVNGQTAVVPPPATIPVRRFTQRLLPDGTEIDEGPAAGKPNAFDEGTNIAAATLDPATPDAAPPVQPPAAQTDTKPPEAPDRAISPETPAPPAAAAPPAPAQPQTAALQPAKPTSIPVAQKAIFYEERSQNEEGTQQSGNVVWSVVSEPPAEGRPSEPAIRAVADVPNENIKMTLTIRRNVDETLPASHVIELMFEVPPGFPGGQIVNVQRLSMKPTEEARGEPLVGVAGKISDGFFIVALNNLSQATQTNLDLLNRQQWIDIPVAYATGRRALMSIEKGIPGDRAFKQAMDAWASQKG